MDAEEGRERRRNSSSRRGQRWSSGELSSQRLELIVRALMRPVMDHGHCFDRDDAGLLEEYLTEAGLRLMEEGGAVPNYAEIGLLLQSYVCNYSRKVDHLIHLAYRFRSELSSLDCRESPSGSGNGHPEPEASPRRRRAAGSDSGGGGGGEFQPIVLTAASASVRRAPAPTGPPPSLPRQYPELRPRDPRPDRALYSAGEPSGSLDDYYVSRRTQRGHLVDELEADSEEEEEEEEVRRGAARLSLMELQAAIERHAAGSPPLASPPPPASPPPHDPVPLYTSTPLPTPAPLSVRKRKLTNTSEESVITLEINVEMWSNMPMREYALPRLWVRRVVRARRDALLSLRRSLCLSPEAPDFRGFDTSWEDIGGFRGWTRADGKAARKAARRLSALLVVSDDDGFFERSSNSLSPNLPDREATPIVGAAADTRWQEEVSVRAALAAPLELGVLARDVRRVLPPPAAPPIAWPRLLAAVRREQPQPARVLLDLLSKATSGELEVLPGTPGRVGDFSVRLRAPPDQGPAPPDP